MSENPAQEVLSDLLGYLESMETQSAAVLQLLKDKGIITDEQLAAFLEQAEDASSVKWRAARMRMEHLFAISDQTQPATSSAKPDTVDKKKKEDSETKVLDKDRDKAKRDENREMEAAFEKKAVSAQKKPVKDAAARPSTKRLG